MILGKSQMFAALTRKHALPYEAELEWLYGLNGAYIDTAIAPLYSTDNIYVDVTISLASGIDIVFGADTANVAIACSPGGTNIYFKSFNPGSAPSFPLRHPYAENRVVLKYENKHVQVLQDGVAIAADNGVTTEATTDNPLSKPIWFYKRNNGSGTVSQRVHKLHRFIIARGGKDILDIIPVVDFDTVCCPYDRVSGSNIYNAGTGTFVAGPRVRGGGVSGNV